MAAGSRGASGRTAPGPAGQASREPREIAPTQRESQCPWATVTFYVASAKTELFLPYCDQNSIQSWPAGFRASELVNDAMTSCFLQRNILS